jgi:hypothetical protein
LALAGEIEDPEWPPSAVHSRKPPIRIADLPVVAFRFACRKEDRAALARADAHAVTIDTATLRKALAGKPRLWHPCSLFVL